MIRKIGLGILLAAVATAASARESQVCKTEYWLGFIPYKVCTTPDTKPTPVKAPEIDAASAVAGLTLMIGGVAVFLGRRKKNTAAV
jgi:LPXTG-motif cell wall-anchored protein